jgi:2-polyprenyl-3-methyl-5-hydroxy-6-metoxy-1,4-benzoquinol methylase
MTDSRQTARKRRLLVVIASYGEKNIGFLKRIIQTYRGMTMEVEVVVLSEAPKDLGAGVKVVVGLPSKNPWSLPFAHKPIFAEKVERYDLFIYSEDDVEVSEDKIRAFLRALEVMEPDEIPGYLRYEVGQGETKLLTDVHWAFHWKPESVRRRGAYTIAEFTNEHAAFYILTQAQLRKAIASGGFLRAPYEWRYDMLCAAATDPYTSCGFRKVICISALEDFLIHHMSNLYVNLHGVSLSALKEQVQTLMDISDGRHPASSLCAVESKFLRCGWSKNYYENPNEEVLSLVPWDAKAILSIGCGWGAMEAKLMQRGAKVTALPLDSVIGAVAARRGVAVIYGTLAQAPEKLREHQFDCVVITNLLHLLPDPWSVLREWAKLVREGGTLVIAGPNFKSIPVLVRRALGLGDYPKLRSFAESGIHAFGITSLTGQIERAGLDLTAVCWFDSTPPRNLNALRRSLGRFMAKDWVIQAQRP